MDSDSMPLTLAEQLAEAAKRLEQVTETPRLDAELLLGHSLGISRSKLLTQLQMRLTVEGFGEVLERRLESEPIAYILAEWEFFSLSFKVQAPLLVPRPETEHLVEEVLDYIGDSQARVLEIGTGTGCVGISIAHSAPNCKVLATDINEVAIKVADNNAQRHELDQNRIEFRLGDLFSVLTSADGPFDVVCSNPPYIEDGAWDDLPPVVKLYEDRGALLAGNDGFEIIRSLIDGAWQYLKPGGLLAFEMGIGQYVQAGEMLRTKGYEAVAFHKDLAGIDRVATARKPE